MEVIIAVVVIGGLIWFGLAVLGSRKDEYGMDAQDRYYHRKAMERQAEADGRAMAQVAVGFMKNEKRLVDQGMTAEQAEEVSRSRVARHREHGAGRSLWDCPACDEAESSDVEMQRMLRDDSDQLLEILEAGERGLAMPGIVRRPGTESSREMLDELRSAAGLPRSWGSET